MPNQQLEGERTRRRILLMSAASLFVFGLAFVAVHYLPGERAGIPLQLASVGSGPFAVDLLPLEAPRDRELRRLGGPDSLSVPVTPPSAAEGETESTSAYVARMLAALEYEGQPLSYYGATSASSEQGWIVRVDSMVAAAPDGRLDGIHLMTYRQLETDVMSPHLLRLSGGDEHLFDLDASVVGFQRSSKVPLLSRFLSQEHGVMIAVSHRTSMDERKLLEEHDASGFVVAKE